MPATINPHEVSLYSLELLTRMRAEHARTIRKKHGKGADIGTSFLRVTNHSTSLVTPFTVADLIDTYSEAL
jgi:hypothetical protein